MEEIGGETLIITEGEFKSLALKEQGWDSIAIAGVNLSQGNLDRLSRIASQYDQVVYVVDDDMGGLLSVPSMNSEMNYRNQKISVQVSKDQDIDDKHAEGEEFDLDPVEPVELLKQHVNRLDDKEHLISKYANKPSDLLEVFYHTVQGLKRSKQESKLKQAVKHINKETSEKYSTNTCKSELKNWREQFVRNKRQRQQNQEDSTTEVSEFQESLEVDGESLKLNPVQELHLQERVRTFKNYKKNNKNVANPDRKFKIFRFTFDEGSNEKEFFLLTSPDESFNLGEKYLPLKHVDFSNKDHNQWVKEKFRKAVKDGYEGSFEEFRQDRFEGRTFEIADHLDQDSVNKIKDMESDVIKTEIVDKYLNNGHSYDEKLRKLNNPKIIRHDRSNVDPEDVMGFNPHSAYITDTSVGKSYNSSRVGIKLDEVSSSGLLGYASADDLRKGTLDGVHEPVFADEMRHNKENNIGDKLLAMLRQGEIRISKGQKDMRPRFYGSFTYMSNPNRESDDNKDEVDFFMDFVDKIGNNTQALSARIGVLLFDDGSMSKAEGVEIPKDRRQKLESIVKWIKQDVSQEYTSIERELREWLNQSYPDSYIDQVNSWKAEVHSDKALEFMDGHKSSYKHARGQALRMAVYQHIGDVLKREHTIDQIKETAKDKFREVLEINLFSLGNLSTLLSDKDRVVQRKKALLESEQDLYLKLFVKSVISKSRNDEEVLESITPVQSLKPVYSEIRSELSEVNQESKYWNFSRIMEMVESNFGRVKQRLEERYGLTMSQDDEILFVKISNSDKFSIYREISSEIVPIVPDVPGDSEGNTPPTHLDEGESQENQGESGDSGKVGGVNKEKTPSTIGTISTKDSESSDSSESSDFDSDVIFSDEPEIGEDIKEETAVKLLKFFQEHGEMKKREAMQEIDTGIDDVGEKLKDLKKLELLKYDQHTHQYMITDKGVGMVENQGLEQVIE
jgi:predicted transcriptional regulator